MASQVRPKYIEVKIKTKEDFDKWLLLLQDMDNRQNHREVNCGYLKPSEKWIYRGQENEEWLIESSFYRHVAKMCANKKICLDAMSLKNIETNAVDDFKRYAALYGMTDALDPVEWLALMQHHRCPTRLVDFSESPYVALYHAVNGEIGKNTDFAIFAFRQDYIMGTEVFDDKYQDEPEQYCSEYFDLSAENEKSRQCANWILSPGLYYKPNDIDDSCVLCIYPKKGNPRLAAQSGLFLMPMRLDCDFTTQLNIQLGLKSDNKAEAYPLDDLLKGGRLSSCVGIRFVFCKKLKREVQPLLRIANITHRSLFPDLDGLARDIKDNYFSGKIKNKKPYVRKGLGPLLPNNLPKLTFETFMSDKSHADLSKDDIATLKETLPCPQIEK